MKLDFDRQSPPLSFTIGDQSSNAVFSSWDRSKIDDGGWRYSDSETELAVEVTVRQFDDAKVVEWMVRFINDGDETSPIITDVLPLNFSWEMSEDDDLHLGHANGSLCRMDDFVPTTTKIRRGEEKTLEPMGGRSSNGVMPFFNVITDDGGFTVAVGWSGGWRSKLNRDDSGCRLIAGMTETSIALGPKESFRTPKMLLVEWDGTEPEIGDNAIRRLLLEHYIPQSEGEPALPPIAHPRQLVYYLTQKADEADHLEAVERAGELGLEAFWVDALWYGGGGDWWEEVGSWRVRKDRFPNGLKPIADAAHEKGMKFVLWFEPERVRAGTDIHRNHPEYLLSIDGDSDNFLYDLGNRDACEFMTDLISEIITEVGVDIYRQDCNIELLPYWEQADGPDQIGFTEAKHIEGLYWMWDELVRRHPGLLIDNCASGGRRIDLETTSRSFPL
ncbi:MAG: alpha-galactosidase, partial [Candidatus Latescibacteria bacterium]|nr:alpha-galactosidase [Candidatus Latescibacterota bacterium]